MQAKQKPSYRYIHYCDVEAKSETLYGSSYVVTYTRKLHEIRKFARNPSLVFTNECLS